jgi:acyl carrier protein
MTQAVDFVKELFRTQLQMGDRVDALTADSPVLGAIPEFDSLAVVGLIGALEEELGVEIADDEIDADMFETVGSLAAFVESKKA